MQDLLALATTLARRAGALLRQPDAVLDVDTKSSPTDVVTQMDTAAEALIVEGLREVRPDDAILGEEGGAESGTSGVRWVVDPIDGTVNYLYGLPQWGVSIAAEVDGRVEVGVVLDPSRDELYAAVRGQGATCNGVPIHASQQTALAQALVATGFGYASSRRRTQAKVVAQLLPQVRDIRRMGAASLDLCAVARGWVDAYYERGLEPWDLAAGGLIAAEAGARVAGLHGRPASGELVVAAPPALFDPLHDLLAELGADHD